MAPIVRGLLWALPCLVALGRPAYAVNSSVWSTVQPILQRNIAVLTAPPIYTPGANVNAVACGSNDYCGLNVPDGPVLGNGGVTAAIGGTAAAQTYTLTTTDFWYGFTTAVVGSVTVNTPGFDSNATYNLAQDPGLAEARATFTEGSQQLKIRSILFATSNVLLIQLNNSGSSAISGIQIVTQAGSVGTEDPLPGTSGVQGTTGYVTRSTAVTGNPYPATDALATYVVDGASTTAVTNSSTVLTTVSVPAGQMVNVVVAVGGGAGSTTYLTDAVTLADSQTDSSLIALINAHEAWWQNFWQSGATVDLGGGPVKRLWYSWLYMLAAADRAGHTMPGMQLIQTEDHNIWLGWWTSDYNIENTYLGVFSANHPELAAPYDASLNGYMTTAMANAGASSSYPEVAAEAQYGPGNNNQYTTDWGCHGDAAWLATTLVYQWNYTRNATWAKTVAYPWMVATAHYWDQHLVNENGYYNVVGSAQNENSSYNLNPIGDLSNLRGLYAALIDMNQSGAVTSSASDLALWETELANLAPLPTFVYNGHTDFKATQDAPGFYGGDAMPVNGAVWAPVLGLGSPAAQLQALQNTIYDLGDNANIWYQNNSIGWIYPAAARAGLPDAYSRLSAITTGRPGEPAEQQANGTVVFPTNTGGGGEGAGNIEAVDEMLLSSYDGVLRLFPAWPMARPVSFSNMAAVGNFQVSSAVAGGIIQATMVVSSAGRTLTIAQPWPGATTIITDNSNGLVVTGNTATVSTPTTAGHSYAVTFSGGTPPATNLAQLGTASASSDVGNIDWWAGYANDGQTASMPSTLGWSSSSNLASDHAEWYQLDLGSNQTFNQVKLWPRSDPPNLGQGFPSSYNVAVSYDGINWTVVATGAASTPTAVVVVPFATQTARYVRINGLHLSANPNDSGQYRMQFAEVGVFNASQSSALSLTLSAPSLTLAPGNGSTITLTAVPTGGTSRDRDLQPDRSAGRCELRLRIHGSRQPGLLRDLCAVWYQVRHLPPDAERHDRFSHRVHPVHLGHFRVADHQLRGDSSANRRVDPDAFGDRKLGPSGELYLLHPRRLYGWRQHGIAAGRRHLHPGRLAGGQCQLPGSPDRDSKLYGDRRGVVHADAGRVQPEPGTWYRWQRDRHRKTAQRFQRHRELQRERSTFGSEQRIPGHGRHEPGLLHRVCAVRNGDGYISNHDQGQLRGGIGLDHDDACHPLSFAARRPKASAARVEFDACQAILGASAKTTYRPSRRAICFAYIFKECMPIPRRVACSLLTSPG